MYPGMDFSTYKSDAQGRVVRGSLDLSFIPIGGPTASDAEKASVCIQTMLRKLQCPPGSMDDETWGMDLRGELNASLASRDLASLGARARLCLLQEEYVDDCDVVCLLSDDGLLIVDVTTTLVALGTYSFAFSLSEEGIQRIIGVSQVG